MTKRMMDGMVTLAAAMVVGAACRAVAEAWDPIGTEARTDLTDEKLAAFLEASVR